MKNHARKFRLVINPERNFSTVWMNVSKGKCKHPWKKLEENENSRGKKGKKMRVCAIVSSSGSGGSGSIDQDEIIKLAKEHARAFVQLSFNIVRESHLSGS